MTASTDVSSYLRRGGLALVGIGVAGFAADYLFNVGLSRLLGAHEYGDFRVAWAFASFFGLAVLLGGDRAAPKTLGSAFAAGETARAWEYLRFYFEVSLLLSVAVVAATWTLSLLHVGTTDPSDHHAVAWVAASVPLNAAGALASRSLQSARRPALAAVPWRIVLPLFSLLLVWLLAELRGAVVVEEAIVVAMLAAAAVTAGQWRLVRRLDLPELVRAPAARVPRRWLATSLPMMGAFLVALALNQSDLYFLEILGDEHEVGLYAAAATSAHFLLMIQTAVVGLVAPLAQPALEAGTETARLAFRRGQGLMLAAVLPAAAVLVLAGRPILALFGSGFSAAAPELTLLAAGGVAWALAALPTLRLQFTGRGGAVVAIAAVTLAADSLLDLALIPVYGMRGAAASTAATTVLAAAAIVLVRRRAASRE